MPSKLSLVETSALILLLDAGREVVPNTYLTENGIKLTTAQQKNLVDLKLITREKQAGRVHYTVTDKGWVDGLSIIGDTPPERSGYRGAVIHRFASMIDRFLRGTGTPPSDFFAAVSSAEEAPAPLDAPPVNFDVAALLRKAYDTLTAGRGEQVSLADLRRAAGELPRADVDEALRALSRESDVYIDPESDQKNLTDAERSAAVSIGNQDKHKIRIVAR